MHPLTAMHVCRQLEKMITRYERNTIDHVPWLDRLAFRRIEQVNQTMQRERLSNPSIVVELERWEAVVSHSFKSYNVILSPLPLPNQAATLP